MSLIDRIEQLEEQRQKLEQQKKELIDKRKIQIGDLALKLKLLDTEDELLLGALVHLKNLLEQKQQDALEELKKLARPFRPKPARQSTTDTPA